MKIKIGINKHNILCLVINKLNEFINKLNSNNVSYRIENNNYEYIIYMDDKYKSVIYDLFKYYLTFEKDSLSIITDNNDNTYISDDYFRKYNLNNVTDNFIEISYFYNYGKNIDTTTDKIIDDLNVIYNKNNDTVLIINDNNLIKLIKDKLKKVNNKYYYDINNRLDKYLV